MMSTDQQAIVLYSAEARCVVDAISHARAESPQAKIVLIAPTAPGLPVDADLVDQHIVLPGTVLQSRPVRKALSREVRVGRGDLVILPMDVFQADSHRRLQLAILASGRGATGLLFGGSGQICPIRWRNLRIHDYPRQLLLASLLLVVGTVLVVREWVRYRFRAGKIRRDRG